MDIKVSMEKAKKMREAASKTPSPAVAAPPPPDACLNGPVYSNCRTVELDMRTLRKNRCVCFFPESPELGYYKLLRTRIVQRCRAENWSTIMITSALPGEGKTLTAINLAATFSMAFGQTALLVDCDFRRQSIHRYLGLESPKGLAEHLQNGTPLNEVIMWPGIEKLTIISGGRPVRDSAELIGSPQMAALAAEMKGRYADRYVFFDLPPILAEADAVAFAPLVDSFLMVVNPETSRDDIQKALDLLPREKFLGFVLNRTETINEGYHYRYMYGYGK